jgi:hypothetical protein
MAIAVVDEVMLREPRLLVPGMQPLGPVKVDWSNPLTQSLTFCWLGRSPHVDLATGRMRTTAISSISAGSVPGIGRYTAYAANCGDTFGAIQPITSNSFTVLSHAAPVSRSAIGSLFNQRKGTSQFEDISLLTNCGASDAAAAGSMRCRCSDTGSSAAISGANAASVIDGLPHVFVGTRINGDAPILYVDGANRTSSTTNGAIVNIYSTAQQTRINNIADFASTGYNNIDPNYLVCCWNRALSPSEVRAISLDPYQFLIPA